MQGHKIINVLCGGRSDDSLTESPDTTESSGTTESPGTTESLRGTTVVPATTKASRYIFKVKK